MNAATPHPADITPPRNLRSVPPAPRERTAEVHLNEWILASPATRAVWGMDRINGKWRIGVCVDDGSGRFERLPAAQHEDYAQCVYNAVEIARLAGYT